MTDERRNLPIVDDPASDLDTGTPASWIVTRVDAVVNWSRRNSLWPMPLGTACCAIEMMASAGSKYDIARFGAERFSFSPRQADLMIVAGRVSYKMAPILRRIWDQMPQPKWCISMGACASSGGMFDNYTIVDMAYALVPHSIIWCVRSDGVLLGLTYVPEQDVWGWHRHDTLNGAVEQVCVVPEANEDAVYLLVRRTVNGATVRYIERLANRQITNVADAFFVDAGLSYDDVPADTFSGLDHLENELVAILADGVVVSDGLSTAYRVVGGAVAIPTAASKVHIGLPIQYGEIEMLNFDVEGVVIRDKKKRVASVGIVIDDSARTFRAGPDADHLTTYTVPTYDPQDSLYHGLVDVNLVSRFDEQARLVIRQTDPLPLTILGLLPRVEMGG